MKAVTLSLSLSAPLYVPLMTWHLSHNAECKFMQIQEWQASICYGRSNMFVTIHDILHQTSTAQTKCAQSSEYLHESAFVEWALTSTHDPLHHLPHTPLSLLNGNSLLQIYIFFQWARCRCFTRHELWLNDLLHISQLKGFSPVWTRWCLERAALSTKPLLHILHLYGLSPVCVRLCVVREPLWANCLLHTLHM